MSSLSLSLFRVSISFTGDDAPREENTNRTAIPTVEKKKLRKKGDRERERENRTYDKFLFARVFRIFSWKDGGLLSSDETPDSTNRTNSINSRYVATCRKYPLLEYNILLVALQRRLDTMSVSYIRPPARCVVSRRTDG